MAQINKILQQPNVLDNKPVHQVRIIGSGLKIIGSLQQDIEISFNPEYKKLSELMVIPVEAMENAAEVIAGGQLFDGITTQKYFTGASYISITITMRVIDTDGSGAPLSYARALASLAQPKKITDANFKDAAEKAKKQFENVLKKGQELFKDATKILTDGDPKKGALEAAYDTFMGDNENVNNLPSKLTGQLMSWLKDNPHEDIESFLKQAAKLYEKNRCVQVEISDYLCFKEMVLESASQTFSQQQGFAGPLFADFTMTFSTRKVPNNTDVKEFYKTAGQGASRVTYIG